METLTAEDLGLLAFLRAMGRPVYFIPTTCGELSIDITFPGYHTTCFAQAYSDKVKGLPLLEIAKQDHEADPLNYLPVEMFGANLDLYSAPLPAIWEEVLGQIQEARLVNGLDEAWDLTQLVTAFTEGIPVARDILEGEGLNALAGTKLSYRNKAHLERILTVFFTHSTLSKLLIKYAVTLTPLLAFQVDREAIENLVQTLVPRNAKVFDIGPGQGQYTFAYAMAASRQTWFAIERQEVQPASLPLNVNWFQDDFLYWKPPNGIKADLVLLIGVMAHQTAETAQALMRQVFEHTNEGAYVILALHQDGNRGARNRIAVYQRNAEGFELTEP